MSYLRNALAAWGTAACLVVSAPAAHAGQTRTMPYEAGIPIANRLLTNDTVVVVERPSPSAPLRQLTLQDELERQSMADAIVLVDGLSSQGVLTDDGAWVRSLVTGSVHRVIVANRSWDAGPQAASFSHDNGQIAIGGVTVRAGVFPVFDPQSRYLLFLRYEAAHGWLIASALRVDGDGRLAAVGQSDGLPDRFETPLIGEPLDSVMGALTRRR
jgi:hypothetical protein